MSNTVKIVRCHKLGGPEVLNFDELPLPEPAQGEVRLRVKAIGLNRAEIMFRNGQYLETPVLPAKNGYEASGIVEAVGPGVDPNWIGKTASTVPGFFSLNAHGVYGEVAVVPVSGIAEYPPGLSYEEGTAIWMQYLTAYGGLIMLGHLAKGDFVLITAASSSVGIAAIEIAKIEGATSIAVTRTAAKKDLLLKLGADHVIVTDEEDLAARVNQILWRHRIGLSHSGFCQRIRNLIASLVLTPQPIRVNRSEHHNPATSTNCGVRFETIDSSAFRRRHRLAKAARRHAPPYRPTRGRCSG